jgi:hypothetical protein
MSSVQDNRKRLPKLSQRKILAWADAYFERTGKWPTHLSGPIPESAGETWGGIHAALYAGIRGFPGGDSLFKLLERSGRRKSRFQRGSAPKPNGQIGNTP